MLDIVIIQTSIHTHIISLAMEMGQLSVWGGPLRLQAAAQNAEKPKHVLRRIIHHPIQWIKEMEEWKHLSSISIKRDKSSKERQRRRREGAASFSPDPLLFPSTWLPLRWLQIFALAKAFSTDPLQYRWCAPEDDKVVIPRLMKQYLVQLALGDEWHRVFLGEKRVGLGIMVVLGYFIGEICFVPSHVMTLSPYFQPFWSEVESLLFTGRTIIYSYHLGLSSFGMDGIYDLHTRWRSGGHACTLSLSRHHKWNCKYYNILESTWCERTEEGIECLWISLRRSMEKVNILERVH